MILHENAHVAFSQAKAAELVNRATRLRQDCYLSQNDVAAELGMASHGGLSRIEQHKVSISLEKFLQLLSVYGYTLEITKK